LGLDVIFPAAMAGLCLGLITGRAEVVGAIVGALGGVGVGLVLSPAAGVVAAGILGPSAGMLLKENDQTKPEVSDPSEARGASRR
jgi:hypothetical protein